MNDGVKIDKSRLIDLANKNGGCIARYNKFLSGLLFVISFLCVMFIIKLCIGFSGPQKSTNFIFHSNMHSPTIIIIGLISSTWIPYKYGISSIKAFFNRNFAVSIEDGNLIFDNITVPLDEVICIDRSSTPNGLKLVLETSRGVTGKYEGIFIKGFPKA